MRRTVMRALYSSMQAAHGADLLANCAAQTWPQALTRCASGSTTAQASGRTRATWRPFASAAQPRSAGGPGPARAAAPKPGAAPPSSQPGGAPTPPTLPLSPFERWYRGFQAAPPITKVLGFAGAIPFIALAPPVSKHLYAVLPHDVIDASAQFQVGYGVTIVSFLGAVHWGMAMGSGLTGLVAAKIAQERYLWSVIPSLLACPLTAMEPGPAAALLAVLLAGCYAWDARSARRGFLPLWYMSLRGPLTLLATFGTLLTATYHLHMEYDRLNRLAAGAGQTPPQQQQPTST